MLLLAFDTATPAVTVALHDGRDVLARHTEVDAMRHGELLAPGIATVLERSGVNRRELTDVAVGVGPGPFTGLRVGLVTARTLGLVLGVRVHGVCTLDVLAAESGLTEPFVVATDARRKEVYWASYAD
ncbi:MAG: tRNA (adenosine(37)-N6)-threonylcarbamoyltransferase complex dimerization subunit type 1 TsaB, partial [Nocardioidaceae bacterium]